jgi:hypothetical protein
MGLVVLLALIPAPAWAHADPETLLPGGAQLYFRWDGIDAHKAAYANSWLGQLLRGDTGMFFTALYKQLEDGVATGLVLENLQRGASPDKLKKMQAEARVAAGLLPLLGKKGLVLAAEVRSLEPPHAQLTVIVPDAGTGPTPVSAALRLAAGLARAQVKEAKLEGRQVASLDLNGAFLAWWTEGSSAVVVLGTDRPEAAVKAMASRTDGGLVHNPLFTRVKSFDRFASTTRAYLDVDSLVRLAAGRGAGMRKVLDDLGLERLKNLAYWSGFEGRAGRSLFELEAPGPRKGVLALVKGDAFTLADVPPLPPDVVSWSVTNLDLGALYDTSVETVADLVRLLLPDNVAQLEEIGKAVRGALGIDVRKDLIGALGGRVAAYSSPGDGPLALGQTLLVRVKDADRLHAALAQAIKGVAGAVGVEVRVKKNVYRGVDMRHVQVRQTGFIFVPTYAVVDGWLVVSPFPQPVEAFIARARGELPAWKPSPVVQELLRQLPERFVSISYSDPAPTVKQVLSIAPLVGGIVANLNQELGFDVGSLPNTQEVTRHLFPNLAVTTDDGTTLRHESRTSLALPLELSGLDTYVLLFAFGALAGAAF